MYALNEIIQPILEGMTGQEAADVIQSNLELLDGTKAPISTVEDIKGLQAEQVELSNKIEEVKETIPTVSGNGSIRINKYKNSIVKSSGFRYIDFDSAVGADETTGEWYTGMLSSDGVHPSVQGAITLYNKAISDFPELVSLKTLSL